MVTLGYVTSGRHLLELTADDYGPRGQSLLAVGGLVYREAKKGYRYLPGTRLKAVKVSKLFRQHFPDVAAPHLLTGAATPGL